MPMNTSQPMQIRDIAEAIVLSEDIDFKLTALPETLEDSEPGPPLRIEKPGRPAELAPRPIREAQVPSVRGYHDPEQRPRILHSFANHELQAVELFAWALLAFPEASQSFRAGLLRILAEEQRHTRMYIARLRKLGGEFGDYPVSGYFWNKTPQLTTPLRFACAMSLTFENANLDHTRDSAAEILKSGDKKTAEVIEQVHLDEIGHVRFGWEWLGKLKDPEQTMWEAYCANVTWPLRPALGRGRTFHRAGREAAGMDPEFIRLLEGSQKSDPRDEEAHD